MKLTRLHKQRRIKEKDKGLHTILTMISFMMTVMMMMMMMMMMMIMVMISKRCDRKLLAVSRTLNRLRRPQKRRSVKGI